MKSPFKALIWEQVRTAGVVCVTLCLVSLFSIIYYHIGWEYYGRSSTEGQRELMLLLAFIGAVEFTLRQDARGHLAWGFDGRLFRLPVKSPALFSIVLGVRCSALLALLAFQFLLNATLPLPLTQRYFVLLQMVLYGYLLMQSAAWAYRRMPVVFNGLAVLILLASLALRLSGYLAGDILSVFRGIVAHPVAQVSLPLFALLVMYVGVRLERQDRYFGPVAVMSRAGRRARLFAAPPPVFRTPFDAQFWYEARRTGWILPIMTVGLTGVFVLLMALFEERPLSSGLGQYAPLLALLLAAPVAGALSLSPRSRMSDHRAVSDSALVAARLLVQLRALFFAALAAGVLSLVLLLASPVEWMILSQFRDEGFVVVLDVLVLVLRPLVLAIMVAWVAMWLLSGPVAMLCVVLLGVLLIVNFFFFVVLPDLRPGISAFGFSRVDLYAIFIYALLSILPLAVCALILAGRFKAVLPDRQAWTLLIVWIALSLFLWLGSRSLDDAVGMMLAWACGAALVLPMASLAWTVRRRRHDIGIRNLRS